MPASSRVQVVVDVLQHGAQPVHVRRPREEDVNYTFIQYEITTPVRPRKREKRAAGSRPVVEVWKRERSREREAGKGDGHARVRARTRALALAARLRLRVRGRDALLLGWGDVRIDLYIPDRFQSVYAAVDVSQGSREGTEGEARTSSPAGYG